MNIYIDESYNLQRLRGKLFISLNGFCVQDDKKIRNHWRRLRKDYIGSHKRIHANNPYFEPLRKKAIKFIKKENSLKILSIFQVLQELPVTIYFEKNKLNYDKIYFELLKKILVKLQLNNYEKVRIVVDAYQHSGGVIGKNIFKKDVKEYLDDNYKKKIEFKHTPSSMDILLELADFISNTFYREYMNNTCDLFDALNDKLIQIKNPL